MKLPPKILRSKTIIRFQDCDPYQHLNNANYIHYFINAREDQLKEHYGIDIYRMGIEQGASWMVTQNNIAYLRPARMLETVNIESQLISYSDKSATVEMRMLDESNTALKAFMWSVFVFVNIRKNTSEKHPEDIMSLFAKVYKPVEEKTFEDRVSALRTSYSPDSSK